MEKEYASMSLADLGHLCLGCMEHLDEPDAPCPHCGCPPGEPHKVYQLPPGSLLAGKYYLGRSCGQDVDSITYIGLDIGRNEKVIIKEYYPSDNASREGGRTVAAPSQRRACKHFIKGKKLFLNASTKSKDSFLENGTAYRVLNASEGYVEGRSPKGTSKTPVEKIQTKKPHRRHGPILKVLLIIMCLLIAFSGFLIVKAVYSHRHPPQGQPGSFPGQNYTREVQYIFGGLPNNIIGNNWIIDIQYAYQYDESGKIVRKALCNSDGEVVRWFSYEYSSDGATVVETTHDTDLVSSSAKTDGRTVIYENKIGSETTDIDSNYTYEYDSYGNIMTKIRRGSGEVYRYEYDSYGNVLSESQYRDSKSTICQHRVCYFYD